MGNRTFIYNQNNRLIRVEQDAAVLGEYTYNALGQRVIKEAGGETTVFLYDLSGNLIGESGSGGDFQAEYLFMGKIRMALVDVSAGTLYYYLNDRLGTPQILTDDAGEIVWEASHKPFGEATVNPNSTITNNIRFPGQYEDAETGLHYNYHRYYNPRTGRYLTPDPSHFVQAPGVAVPFLLPLLFDKPQELNSFNYTQNNPINLIDLRGLQCGPGWLGDLFVPDKPGGFDFSICCRRHDDCYAGRYDQCIKDQAQCDEEFYECMRRVCDYQHLSNRSCYQLASKYWYYVDKYGTSAFEEARDKGPCHNPCK